MNIFAIGLGGAGSSIVGEIVKEYERSTNSFKLEDNQTINFDYALIDFQKGLNKLKWDWKTENAIKLDAPKKDWILNNISKDFPVNAIPSDTELGTGRSRPYSKSVFAYNNKKILDALSNQLSNFCKDKRSVTIWIFTSYGGGTGSGMFLDFSMEFKEQVIIAEIEEIAETNCTTILVGVLPSAVKKGDDAKSPLNAVQAFKELNYLISETTQNPFDQIFVVGLHRNMTELERTELMMDTLIAKCIIGYFCGVKDINDVFTEIQQHEAGIESGKFLSMSMASYYYPMSEIVERYNSEKQIHDLRKKIGPLEDEFKENSVKINKHRNKIKYYEDRIEEIEDSITEVDEKVKISFFEKRRINKWQKEISNFEAGISKQTNLMNPFMVKNNKIEQKLNPIKKNIEILSERIANIKLELDSENLEKAFMKEIVDDTKYKQIIDNFDGIPNKNLNELYDETNGTNQFVKMIEERKEHLIDSQPLSISRKEKIPFIEIGYTIPEKIPEKISTDILNQHHSVADKMGIRKTLWKTSHELNIYAIIAGIKLELVNDFKVKDFINEYSSLKPDVINSEYASLFYGHNWSEYNPDWLTIASKSTSVSSPVLSQGNNRGDDTLSV